MGLACCGPHAYLEFNQNEIEVGENRLIAAAPTTDGERWCADEVKREPRQQSLTPTRSKQSIQHNLLAALRGQIYQSPHGFRAGLMVFFPSINPSRAS